MHDLRVGVDGAVLAVSHSASGDSALVAVHGASAGTRAHPLYEHLHRALPPLGIGVATFDRRGDGESTGLPSRGQFERQARDALAVADALEVDRIGLWGFSQGGWVAPLAATFSPRIRALVLVASTGVNPAAQMRHASREHVRRAGFGEKAADRAAALWRACEAWIRAPEAASGAQLQADLVAASREPWWELAFLQTELLNAREREAWLAEMTFDPGPVFAATRAPTLLFYGGDDVWIPVDASVATWRRARGSEVEAVVIPEASHELTLPDGTLAPAYEERMLAWLPARLSE